MTTKFSVSVPPDLLAKAEARYPGKSRSAIIQLALKAVTEEEREIPDWAQPLVDTAAESLRAMVRQDYEDGYAFGCRFAQKEGAWPLLVRMSHHGFTLEEVSDLPEWHLNSAPWRTGFCTAVRDVWETATKGLVK